MILKSLIMGAPYSMTSYHDELLALSNRHEHVHYDWSLSREDATPWDDGLISRNHLETPIQICSLLTIRMYICGLAECNAVYTKRSWNLVQQSYINTIQRGGRVHMRPSPRCLSGVLIPHLNPSQLSPKSVHGSPDVLARERRSNLRISSRCNVSKLDNITSTS